MRQTSLADIDEEIKDFLSANDYIASITKIEEDVICLKLPIPIDKKNSIHDVFYKIKEDGVVVSSGPKEEEFWSCPRYALRLMILSDILNRMRKIPVHEALISYYNQEGEEVDDLFDIISAPSEPEEKNKEGFLTVLISESMDDDFPAKFEEAAETHKVSTGYRLIKSFF